MGASLRDRAGHEPSQSTLSRPSGDHPLRVSSWEMGVWIRAAVAETFGLQSLEAIDKRGSGKVYRLIPHPAWEGVGDYVLTALKTRRESDGSPKGEDA
jgi:hypothetical protein